MMKHRELFLLLFTLGSIAMGDEAPDKNVGLYSPVGKRDPFQVPKMNPRDLASNGEDLFKYPLESFHARQSNLAGGSQGQEPCLARRGYCRTWSSND